ncbi:MAG: Nif3-like dinuclear metal center hexameric protein [Acetivibrionales bacterium]
MPKCIDIISFIEEVAQPELAEKWDNTGLLIGSGKENIKRILLSLDVTSAAVKLAADKKVDLILTHHPVIFTSINRLNPDEAVGRLIYSLVKSGISVYTAHTNMDHAETGVNAQLALRLGIRNAAVMGNGPGRYGETDKVYNLDEFASMVKSSLNTRYVRVVGKVSDVIRSAAVFSGAFDGDLDAFRKTGADVLVTGDVKYHTALYARESGLCIIDAGHFATEAVVLPALKDMLNNAFPDVEIICFQQEDPFIIT